MAMRLITLTFLGLLLFMAFNIFALDPNPQGELDVQIAVSGSPEYIRQWIRRSSSEPIFIKSIKEVVPGQTFYVAFIVTGYGINEKGMIDLIGDFVLEGPNGEIIVDRKKICISKGPIIVPTGFVMLDPALDLTLEEESPEGVYVIKAVVRDNVFNRTAKGEYNITLEGKGRVYFLQGLEHYKIGKYKKAIAKFKKAIDSDPNDIEARFYASVAYLQLGQPQDAIKYLEKAIEINPSYDDAYCQLGAACGMLGQYNNAILHFQKAIEINPDNATAHSNLGFAYYNQNQYQQALIYYQKAKEMFQNRGDYQSAQSIEETISQISTETGIPVSK